MITKQLERLDTSASAYALQQALQLLFAAQARDVLSRLNLDTVAEEGTAPGTAHWIQATANVARPIFLRLWQLGMLRQRQALQIRQPKKALRINLAFDLFDPHVLDAVDEATLQFCRETNETATMALTEATHEIRQLLRQGLERGEALQYLARKIQEIYADPYRAFRIAATETSRAMHGGQLYSMKEDGVTEKKQWLASSDACPLCLELDGQERDLDEPFVIDGRGPYARIMTPPRHPHCFCDLTSVL